MNSLEPTNRTVLVGAALLAFGAAWANISMVLQTGASISHLTGDVSRLSIDLVRGSPELLRDLVKVACATGSFFAGAVLAGIFIHHPELDLKRPYGRSICGIGLAFVLAGALLPGWPSVAIVLAAFACGFQNSLASRYRGFVLRTTHLTGLITDFGITLGMNLRGFHIPPWKLKVPALLLCSYFAGGATACFVHAFLGRHALSLIGAIYILMGLLWTVYKHHFMQAKAAPGASPDALR